MYYESLVDKLMDEKNTEVIELFPEGFDESIKFEQLGMVFHNNIPYAILKPIDLRNAKDSDKIVIFKLNPDDEESLDMVTDEKLAEEILEVFNNEEEE